MGSDATTSVHLGFRAYRNHEMGRFTYLQLTGYRGLTAYPMCIVFDNGLYIGRLSVQRRELELFTPLPYVPYYMEKELWPTDGIDLTIEPLESMLWVDYPYCPPIGAIWTNWISGFNTKTGETLREWRDMKFTDPDQLLRHLSFMQQQGYMCYVEWYDRHNQWYKWLPVGYCTENFTA